MNILLKQLRNLVLLCGIGVILISIAVIPKSPMLTPDTFDFIYILETTKEIIMNILSGEGLGKSERNTYYVAEATTFFLRSIKIFIPAFFVSIVMGVLLGLVSYQFRKNIIGKSIYSIHLVFSSLPDFFAFILIQYGLLIVYMNGIADLDMFGHERWYNTILPVISLSLYPIFYIYRITSASIEEESKKDYVSTVRAKGKSDTYILYTHLLWNTWARVLTNIRTVILYILTSLPIIELLGFYQGMGYRILKAVQSNEVLMIVALLYPFLLVVFIALLLHDILSFFLVPVSVEAGQALRPMKSRKIRKYVVWGLTKIINEFL